LQKAQGAGHPPVAGQLVLQGRGTRLTPHIEIIEGAICRRVGMVSQIGAFF
jgi:hypothetical protein